MGRQADLLWLELQLHLQSGNFHKVPYGQPINSGYYVGYGVSIDTFLTAANTAGSIFYTSRSTYDGTSSLYYANDCSAFVSWCWGVDRKTTYSIPQVSDYIGMATASNAYSLQLGDCLNSNDVGHVVLVTGLTYNSSGTLTQIEITEQTPPQLKRSYYTPSSLGSKYGTYYGIYRYYGSVPASPDGSSGGSSSGGSSSGSTSGSVTTKYYPACASSFESFYPAMESIGVSCDWTLHQEIAAANGITDFSGTVEQNTQLLNLLKAGKLLNPNYTGSDSGSSGSGSSVSYYPACASSFESFYPAMESIGVTCDWTLHQEIAAANGITNFSGTVEQNTQLLNLLKAGKLIIPGSGSGSSGSGSVGDSVVDGKNGYDRGYAGGMPGDGKIYAHGLDVSSWQGSSLDFNIIKNGGYDFVILRAGTTKGKDELFETYYTRAKAAGLDVGAYYYSYATTTSAAKSDANNMISWISGKTFEYPIYFDYEDASQDGLSTSTAQSICLTFMDALADKGYLVGMYTGYYKSTQLPMDTICDRYEFWVANYYDYGYTTLSPSYSSKYGMYQYTDRQYIGSYGGYDANVAFKDYPTICKTYGFNGYTVADEDSGSSSGGSSGGTSSGTGDAYFDLCTFYPSHCQLTVSSNDYIYSLPVTTASRGSEKMEAIKVGDTLTATGLYSNSGGNLWYRVSTSDGQTGYVYSGRVKFDKKLYSDIKLSSASVPEAHVKGNVFLVEGTVKSTYNDLTKVEVSVYSGFGTSGTKVTGGSASVSSNSYKLNSSAVDDATAFNELSAGKYTYSVKAYYTSYYHSTTKEVATITSSRTLKKTYFVVVPSAANQDTCSHAYTTDVLTAHSCTEEGSSIKSCSICGLVSKFTVPAAHTYKSEVTKPEGTADGYTTYTCTVCGDSYTETIPNYMTRVTEYPSHCQIKVTKDTSINTLPLSSSNDDYVSTELQSVTVDDTLTAIGLVQNHGGNLWYKVMTTGGEVGYVFGSYTTYVKDLTSDITLKSYNVPNAHVKGATFTPTGKIKSTYNELTKAYILVYEGFATSGTKVVSASASVSDKSFNLSDLAAKVTLADVATGKYTYAVKVKYTSYYAVSKQEIGTSTDTVTLTSDYFMVIPSAANQGTCSHKFSTTTLSSATCAVDGVAIKSCSACGLITQTSIPASHSFGSWSTANKATCTAEGLKQRTCSACGYAEHQTIPATGHKYTDKITAPTCTTDGHTTHTCSSCGHSYFDTIVPAAGHKFTDKVTKPTCTDAGFTTHTCRTCGHSYIDTLVQVAGHKYVDGTCDVCGAEDPEYIAPTEPETFTVSLAGTMNGWDSQANMMTGSGSVVTTTMELAAGEYFFKIVCNDSWYGNYGTIVDTTASTSDIGWEMSASADNCTLKATGGSYTFTFNTETKYLVVTCQLKHSHSYTAKVTAPTCTEGGYTTYTCACGDSYVGDTVPAKGHSHTAKVTAPTCTEDGYTTYTCACGDSYVGDKVPAKGHSYSGGTCGVCGAADPDYTEPTQPTEPAEVTAYLAGSMNGWSTTANPLSGDGTTVSTTVTLAAGEYTFKIVCDGAWYGNNGTIEDTTEATSAIGWEMSDTADNCVLKATGGSYTFTFNTETKFLVITHVPAAAPTGKVEPKSATLSLEDEVLINLYFIVEEMEVTPENVGMLIYNEKPETPNVSTADTAMEGGLYNPANGRYMVSTPGIPGQYLADTLYLVAYAKDANGNYVYARTVEYSGKKYCDSQMTKGTPELKATCVALMNYGAAAQEYFAATTDYTYDTLMNADFAQYQNLVVDYSEDLLAPRGSVDAAKAGSLGTKVNGFTKRSVSMSADGDFSLNYYLTTDKAVDKVTFYCWTADQYNSVDTLTLQNASGSKEMVLTDGTNRYWANVSGIAAKDIDKTVYACGVYEVNGVTYSSGVFSYSIGYYCTTKAAGTDEVVKPFAKAIAVYSYHARIFLESLN